MVKVSFLKIILIICEGSIGGGEEWVWLRGYLLLLYRKSFN